MSITHADIASRPSRPTCGKSAPGGQGRSRPAKWVAFAASFGLLAILAPGAALAAGQTVTYSWVTDSFFSGSTLPSASFDVPLSVVETGTFTQLDMSNFQFSFSGIGPLAFTTGTSNGLDNAAFVSPTTYLPVFKDSQQGLGAVGYQGSLGSSTFLTLTFDLASGSQVRDVFNAINGGPGSLSYGSGHWIASVSAATAVPEPTGIALLGAGLLALAVAGRRRRARVRS